MCQPTVGRRRVLRWGNREKLTQSHGDVAGRHSLPGEVPPACCWSPPLRASKCPLALKPPPGLLPHAL